jgi:hypothetical protein
MDCWFGGNTIYSCHSLYLSLLIHPLTDTTINSINYQNNQCSSEIFVYCIADCIIWRGEGGGELSLFIHGKEQRKHKYIGNRANTINYLGDFRVRGGNYLSESEMTYDSIACLVYFYLPLAVIRVNKNKTIIRWRRRNCQLTHCMPHTCLVPSKRLMGSEF